jgi:hypothetical protein
VGVSLVNHKQQFICTDLRSVFDYAQRSSMCISSLLEHGSVSSTYLELSSDPTGIP